ncbi:MAG: ankyrin repeat domain-containing protein [Pirellulaceae bacterium]
MGGYDGDFFDAVEFCSLGDAQRYYSDDIDLDYLDETGKTVLMIAAYYGHVDVIRWLLEKGAQKDIVGPTGERAVDIAQAQGHNKAARLLRTP